MQLDCCLRLNLINAHNTHVRASRMEQRISLSIPKKLSGSEREESKATNKGERKFCSRSLPQFAGEDKFGAEIASEPSGIV